MTASSPIPHDHTALPVHRQLHVSKHPGSPSIFETEATSRSRPRIAGHESTRTTQLHNRLREEISLDEIERIHI